MATDFVTLDTLGLGDSPAGDNSPASGNNPGAKDATVPSTPAGPDVSARIAAMEARLTEHAQLTERHRQQLHGSQQEIARLQGQLQAQQHQAQPTPAPVAPAPQPQRVSIADGIKRFVLDNDESALQAAASALEAQWQAQGQSNITSEKVQEVLQAHQQQQDAKQRAQTVTISLQQALVQRHPELANTEQHSAFTNATEARYHQLLQDPVTQLTYAPDQAAMFTVPSTGAQYDMRVLMQAANEVKAKQPPAATPPSLGTNVGGTPPVSKGPAVPRHLVEGQDAVLQNPQVQQFLASKGWGASVKEQLNTLLKHTSADQLARWQRGEA